MISNMSAATFSGGLRGVAAKHDLAEGDSQQPLLDPSLLE